MVAPVCRLRVTVECMCSYVLHALPLWTATVLVIWVRTCVAALLHSNAAVTSCDMSRTKYL